MPKRSSGPGARRSSTCPRAEAAVLCGDMNCEPDSAEYQAIVGGAGGAGVVRRLDAVPPGVAHAPTVGLHGAEWPDRAYCCDFLFTSASLAANSKDVRVLAETAASDHQPVLLALRF